MNLAGSYNLEQIQTRAKNIDKPEPKTRQFIVDTILKRPRISILGG